ncbi:MAG: hypothetical protein AABX71_00935 [Nanoarchaeota archaeon]
MGVLIRKGKGVFIFTGIAKLAVIGLLVSLSSALIDTIWAVYMDGFMHSVVLVGFFLLSLLSSLSSLTSFLYL